MKVTRTISELVGVNSSSKAGEYIEGPNRDFITKGVVVGVSILYNQTNERSATVTSVTSSRIDALGLGFNPGDFWKVSLSTPWTVQTEDGPLVEVQCKRCGFSYPNKTLVKGRCPTCVDTPQRTKTV